MRARALGALVMLLVLAGPAAAANFHADLQHTILARTTLLRDPRLAPLNLGVKVHDRVAVLWGTVPNPQLAGLAEELLRALPDFVAVRNELHIDGEGPVAPPAQPIFLPQVGGQETRPTVPMKPRAEPAAPARASLDLPVIGGIAVASAVASTETPTPLCMRKPMRSPGFLTTRPLPWAPPAVAPAVVQPPHVLLPPEPSPEKTVDQAVRDLQQSREDFRRVEVVVREAEVTIRGPANLRAIPELARQIARLPGVERVILREP